MRIPGKRVERTWLIQSDKYIVAVEVDMVIPADDPSEPCYESETVRLLREVKEHADKGDVDWLTVRAANFTPPLIPAEPHGYACL